MMDVHENPSTIEPAVEENVSALNDDTATVSKSAESNPVLSREAIVEQLRVLVEKPIEEVKEEIELLKQSYYKTRKAATPAPEEGEESEPTTPEAIEANPDTAAVADEELKRLLAIYKEKKTAYQAEQEAVMAANLATKQQILDRIKEITLDSDNINKHFTEFQQLQQSFKEVVNIPVAAASDMWKNYQVAVETFYDLLNINKELRDYDFKKNLKIQESLCQQAGALADEEDIVAAFRALQQLHEEWKATGPVAKELREEMWVKFKNASTVVNKKHQTYFEVIKERENENELAKTTLCEEIEQISIAELNSFATWEEQTKAIIALQERWKTIGFASRKMNNLLFERFRKSCDQFFKAKAEYYHKVKEEMAVNYEKKKVLCEKAEALKDSTDWKKTTDAMVAIQKEWKTIGTVAKKYSDQLWNRFIAACDYFFEQKELHTSSHRKVEAENLKQKKEIVAKLAGLDTTDLAPAEAIKEVKAMMAAWNTVGHVPFKEKDKIYKEYQAALDVHFKQLNMQENKRRLNNYSSNINKMASEGSNLQRERDRLMRSYEQKKGELKTYENNMGFLNISSKSGGGMLKEMERKMDKIREEMEVIIKKIELIDQNS